MLCFSLGLPSATYFFIRKKVSKILGEKIARHKAGTRTHIFRLSLPTPNIAGKVFPKEI